ncbi:alpha/beta-hydrolase [Ilyonectria robusta]
MMSTFIAFVNSLDPNNHGLADVSNWLTWEPEKKSMLQDAESGCEIIKDDFREKEINFINNHANDFTIATPSTTAQQTIKHANGQDDQHTNNICRPEDPFKYDSTRVRRERRKHPPIFTLIAVP